MSRDIEKALRAGGNTHTFQDVLAAIVDGKMQSFQENDTWLVTQVVDFPRRRVLELFLLVGDYRDVPALEKRAQEFALKVGASQLRAFGRPGWNRRYYRFDGWRVASTVFAKDIQ